MTSINSIKEQKLLQKMLDFERMERKSLESKVLEMVDSAVRKWRVQEKQLKEDFAERLEKEKIEKIQLQNVLRTKEVDLQQALDKIQMLAAGTPDKSEMRTMRRDLANSQIDNRVLKRDLAKEKETNASLLEKLRNASDCRDAALKDVERERDELKEKTQQLESDVSALRSENDSLKSSVKTLQNDLSDRNSTIERMSDELITLKNSQQKLSHDLTGTHSEIQKKNSKLAQQEDELRKCHESHERTRSENESLKDRLNEMLKSVETLKSLVKSNDLQLSKYENLVLQLEKRETELKKENHQMVEESYNVREQLAKAKQNANEERSFKLLAESRCKRIQDELDTLTREHDQTKQSLNRYVNSINELNDQLALQKNNYDILNKDYEAMYDVYESLNRQCTTLQEEARQQVSKQFEMETKIEHLEKESMYIRDKYSKSVLKVNELNAHIEELEASIRDKETRFEVTSKQQLKLIEFLQNKLKDK